jgi:hypothetical protein
MLAVIHMDTWGYRTQAPDSSIAFSLLFMAHRCSLPDGTGCDCLYGSGDEGSIKGNEPLGDA